MNAFNHILYQKSRRLRDIWLKSQQINHLDSLIKSEILEKNLCENFRVANVRNTTIVLEFTNANWVTRGKFYSAEIINIAKRQHPEIKGLHCYVKNYN